MKPLATNTLPSAENFQTPPTDGALSIPALSANFPISSFSSMLEVNYTKNPRLNGRDFRGSGGMRLLRVSGHCRIWRETMSDQILAVSTNGAMMFAFGSKRVMPMQAVV